MNAIKDLLFGRTWKGSLARIFALIVFALAPFGYHYQTVWVDGISMVPTYDDGQWTLMQRHRSFGNDWVPDRFDAIVVWDEENDISLCKRVVGLPGEKVEIKNGKIFINNREVRDTFGKGYMVIHKLVDPDTDEVWWKEYDNIESQVIAPDHVWVIGDNREDSIFGHFPIKEIRGKIVMY